MILRKSVVCNEPVIIFATGAISAKLMLTSSAAKHMESRVTVIFLCFSSTFKLSKIPM